jgi:hypothetical protein
MFATSPSRRSLCLCIAPVIASLPTPAPAVSISSTDGAHTTVILTSDYNSSATHCPVLNSPTPQAASSHKPCMETQMTTPTDLATVGCIISRGALHFRFGERSWIAALVPEQGLPTQQRNLLAASSHKDVVKGGSIKNNSGFRVRWWLRQNVHRGFRKWSRSYMLGTLSVERRRVYFLHGLLHKSTDPNTLHFTFWYYCHSLPSTNKGYPMT